MNQTADSDASATPAIRLVGVRVHNLRGIDVEIPTGIVCAVTGVSGSGKSSLAFDAILAEGQRLYFETFPASVRARLPKMDRPAVDRVENMPPAIGVAQHRGAAVGDATIGSATGVFDLLRLLYARASTTICPRCDLLVAPASPEVVASRLMDLPEGSTVSLGFRIETPEQTDWKSALADLRRDGFRRLAIDDCEFRIEDASAPPPAEAIVRVVVDRVSVGSSRQGRIVESLETAFARGVGQAEVRANDAWTTYSRDRRCTQCGSKFPDPAPALFHPSNPHARCQLCEGDGRNKAGTALCPECEGSGFRPEILAFRYAGWNFAQAVGQAVSAWREKLSSLNDPRPAAKALLQPLQERVAYLHDVGLDYLSLDRPLKTLSTGEARRVALTAAFGTGLAHTVFVLDEPTAGLHPQDVGKLIAAMRALADEGNTVIVVEHDPAVVQTADHVVDLGPGAGTGGGRIVFEGNPVKLATCETSRMARWLRGRVPPIRRPATPRGHLQLIGARRHNLQNLDVRFPLGGLCVAAGVSGAGKSTLVVESLYPALRHALGESDSPLVDCDRIEGIERIDEVILIGDESVGRTSRGNPATYLKMFDDVRKLFAETLEAKVRGLGPGDFSFNVAGGRCVRCEGTGELTTQLQFLPEVRMTCPDCGGTRYESRILEVKYRGKNIAEVLAMTAREAMAFFRGQTKTLERLSPLLAVGLDYLPLGQPLSALSGGEARRLQLCAHLSRSGGRRTLFLLEEPTIGLHPDDVEKLLTCWRELIDTGHSLIVVEHDEQVLRAADYIIELGPGAGDAGGRIVAEGTPAQIADRPTATGRLLARQAVSAIP